MQMEAYSDTNGAVYVTSNQQESKLLQRYWDRNERSIVIGLPKYQGKGWMWTFSKRIVWTSTLAIAVNQPKKQKAYPKRVRSKKCIF